jgi:hypothetical protein
MLIESKSEPTLVANPWMLYLYAMRSPATKEKYLMRLGKFLDFLNLQGTLENKARFFAHKGRYDSAWAFNSSNRFPSIFLILNKIKMMPRLQLCGTIALCSRRPISSS